MLTQRQEAFVNAYVSNGFNNGTEAAVKAGYSEKTATQISARLLKKEKIIQAINERRQTAKEVAIVDATWVLKRLKEMVEVSMVRVDNVTGMGAPITLAGTEQTSTCFVDAKAANTALKTLAGCLGIDGKQDDKDASIQTLAETLQDAIRFSNKQMDS